MEAELCIRTARNSKTEKLREWMLQRNGIRSDSGRKRRMTEGNRNRKPSESEFTSRKIGLWEKELTAPG
jgi:hypothetical protein